jgi:hypothetical protein
VLVLGPRACLRVCPFLSPLASKNGISESGSSEYDIITCNRATKELRNQKLEREVRIIDHGVQGDNVLFMEAYYFLSPCDVFLAKHRWSRASGCRYWNENRLLWSHCHFYPRHDEWDQTPGLDLIALLLRGVDCVKQSSRHSMIS